MGNPAMEISPEGTYVSITMQVAWANIRSGPSMQDKVLRYVSAGFPLMVVDRKDGWSQVEDFSKRKGWVADRLLAENNSVIVKIPKELVRREPNMNALIVQDVEYGITMQVEEMHGSWVKVSDMEGLAGWIPRTSVWP